MAKGREGFLLEGWKFSVYLIIPIAASVYYSEPKRQKAAADYWQYVRYPANPNVGMKQQIEEMVKQQKQREAYSEQMKLLNEQAINAEIAARQDNSEETPTNYSWLRWFGFGKY